MRDEGAENLSKDLLELLGEDAFFRLVENHAGCRLFVPKKLTKERFDEAGTEISDPHPLVAELGLDAARLLSDRYAGNYIRVPLARELRAQRYRREGLSNAKIAVRLGLTESGVDKLFHRRRAQQRLRVANSNPRPAANCNIPAKRRRA